jgi:hypothetical protein
LTIFMSLKTYKIWNSNNLSLSCFQDLLRIPGACEWLKLNLCLVKICKRTNRKNLPFVLVH